MKLETFLKEETLKIEDSNLDFEKEENILFEELEDTTCEENSGNFIYLTEDGFSQPVGTFNSSSRVAKLNKNIENKTLVITISNVLLNGNEKSITQSSNRTCLKLNENVKNISIKNIYLETYGIGIYLLRCNKDITIECVKFCNCNYGVIARGCYNIEIVKNEFLLNKNGIMFIRNCNNNCISNNNFVDNNEGIYLNSSCNSNVIVENNFKNQLSDSVKESAITLKYRNCYNRIEDNRILFADKVVNVDRHCISKIIAGIFLKCGYNVLNKISNNDISFRNNRYNLNSGNNTNLNLAQIYCASDNNSCEISNNTCNINNNVFNSTSNGMQELNLNNIYITGCSKTNLIDNICNLENNSVSYGDDVGVALLENIKLNRDNNSCGIISNNVCCRCNEVSNNNNNLSVFGIKCERYNNSCNILQNSCRIKDNNTEDGFGIWLDSYNSGNEISDNQLVGLDDYGIVLNNCNTGNVVLGNLIKNINSVGIILVSNNNSNIIANNDCINIKDVGIILVVNNDCNVIAENCFDNSGLCILVVINNSNNIISCNEFFNSDEGIVILNSDCNILFGNKNQCKCNC